MKDSEEDSKDYQAMAAAGYPLDTQITKEMLMHTEAMCALFTTEAPPTVSIQPTDKEKLRYYVGGASAEGFGFVMQYLDMHLK